MRRLACASALLVAGCGVLLGSSDGEDPKQAPVTSAREDAGDSDAGVIDTGDAQVVVTDDAGSDAPVEPPVRIVFVTEGTTMGNIGGLAGGDVFCAAEAVDAGLTGQFVAWLSNGDDTFDAKSRFSGDAGWHLPNDGGKTFAGPSAMTTTSHPKLGIDRTARGKIIDDGEVWTGLWGDGTRNGKDCAGWTTTNGDGVFGRVGATDETWTTSSTAFCDQPKRLYCFQK